MPAEPRKFETLFNLLSAGGAFLASRLSVRHLCGGLFVTRPVRGPAGGLLFESRFDPCLAAAVRTSTHFSGAHWAGLRTRLIFAGVRGAGPPIGRRE